jgi:hypothetical protein
MVQVGLVPAVEFLKKENDPADRQNLYRSALAPSTVAIRNSASVQHAIGTTTTCSMHAGWF